MYITTEEGVNLTGRVGFTIVLICLAIAYFVILGIGYLIQNMFPVLVDIVAFVLLGIGIIFIGTAFVYAGYRCNDLGKSRWLLVLMVVPYVNIIFLLYLLFANGLVSQIEKEMQNTVDIDIKQEEMVQEESSVENMSIEDVFSKAAIVKESILETKTTKS